MSEFGCQGVINDPLTALVWTQGRMLQSGNYRDNNFSYEYDADGYRVQKTVNGLTTRYYLDGERVLFEERLNASGVVTSRIYYHYDLTGIAGMVYNGSTYFFRKNILGDVTDVYNNVGTRVAGYAYDAWGNCTVLYNSSGLADVNPFRYRGYYYDSETGFYYLNSRYYDPEIRRFINSDDLELLPLLSQTVGQLNLYAYANGNPIAYTDSSGTWIETAWDAISFGMSAKDFIEDPSFGNFFWMALDALSLIVPFMPAFGGSVKLIGKAAGAVDDVFDASKVANKADNIVEAITAPTNRKGLRNAMIKAEGIPTNLAKPEAHHLAPWAFKDKFAKYGVDVNLPQFGKWVEGGKGSKHAKLSYEYNKKWDDFFKKNEGNLNYEKIVDQINQWRNYI